MKNLSKNFIAFTLSEMMIVLLIVSVISAATLPTITSRNTAKPVSATSIWQYDNLRTFSYYYANNADTDIVIGNDLGSTFSLANKFTAISNYGRSPLKLARPSLLSYVTQNRSDIAFFNKDGIYQGKIAADSRGNIAVGKNSAYPNASSETSFGNLFIGSFAGNNLRYSPEQRYNTIVGYGALMSSYAGAHNVVIGNTQNVGLQDRNIVIGIGAASKTRYQNDETKGHQNSISIGAYASYNTGYAISSLNVGFYAGARPDNKSNVSANGYNNYINIGSFAGYYSGNSISNSSNVNIGYYAGSRNQLYSSISIGHYSGFNGSGLQDGLSGIGIGSYAQVSDANISLGNYAGYIARLDNDGLSKINIGDHAGYRTGEITGINIGSWTNFGSSVSDNNINIGRSAGQYSNYIDSINIGTLAGKYSFSDNSIAIGYGANVHSSASASRVSTDNGSIVIGCKGAAVGAHKMCIGGLYPFTSNHTLNGTDGTQAWNATSSTYSTLITTPHYQGYGSSGWNYTAIYLLANYVLSYQGSMKSFSDRTLKENIKHTKYGIDKLRNINVYQFNFKGNKAPRIGVIAQELIKYYPNAVSQYPLLDGANDLYYSVSTDWIMYSLAQSIKDVDKAAISLQKELTKSLALISKLAVRVNSIENRLNNIAKSNMTLQSQLKEIDAIINDMERK